MGDRSVQKLQSRSQAEGKLGGTCCLRKIPVKRFGPLGHHPVLNIDVVVRILAERLRRRDEGDAAWPSILLDCLPQRHLGVLAASRRLKEIVDDDGGEKFDE